MPGVGVAVEADRAVGQAGHRRDEAHDVAGEAAVDLGAAATGPGVTTQSASSTSSMRAPRARRAPAMRRVSRERSGARRRETSFASAARTR